MEKIIQAIENDIFGHESWIVIGNEQHKHFWYAIIGDCGWTNELHNKPDFFQLEVVGYIQVKAKTFPELLKKIQKEIDKREVQLSKLRETDINNTTVAKNNAGENYFNP